jgi:two-component system phosphate regulon response regulator PhoB
LARLLVVDSSPEDRSGISRYLRDAGHEALCAPDVGGALALMRGSAFDAVITEWQLADISALELVILLQRNPESAGTRILVASARPQPGDIARALESGIDDCLMKPLRPEELVARVNAALRRPPAQGEAPLRVGPVALDRIAHKITVGGQELDLAPAEFRLMAYFMENPGRVVGRRQLLAQVWNRRKGIGERTVDVHVRRLRAAMSPHGCDNMLQTVRGFGYRFG